MVVDHISEIPAHRGHAPPSDAFERAREEIPLFLAIRFVKVEPPSS
jgi:hypothetical protein